MTNTEFLAWLNDQDYWVLDEDVEKKADECNVEFRRMIGITKKMSDDGKPMTPKRDYRKHLK